jgi:hypothetical protein
VFSDTATITVPQAPPVARYSFSGTAGEQFPQEKLLSVGNTGGVATVSYGAGQPTGWLTATTVGTGGLTLISNAAPVSTPGIYTATVTLGSVGPGGANNTVEVTLNVQAPGAVPLAPTDLRGSISGVSFTGSQCGGAGCVALLLYWRVHSHNATDHRIEGIEGIGGNPSVVRRGIQSTQSGPVGYYENPNAQKGRTYVIRVRSCNANGCSAPSNEITVTTPGATVSLNAATEVTDTSARLNATVNDAGFRMTIQSFAYWGTDENQLTSRSDPISSMPKLSYTIKGLTPNTTYYYRFETFYFGGSQPIRSEIANFKTAPSP